MAVRPEIKKKDNRPSFVKEKHLSALDSYVEAASAIKLATTQDDSRFDDLTLDELRKTLFYYHSIMGERPRVKTVRRIDRAFGG